MCEDRLLDVTQGTRQSTALYTPRKLFNLDFDRATSSFPDWPQISRRAKNVSVTIKPGRTRTVAVTLRLTFTPAGG